MAIQIQSIEELLHKDPFSPFKILTADGKEYPVQNPDFVHVFLRRNLLRLRRK